MYPTVASCNKMLLNISRKIESASDVNERDRLICEYNTKKFVLSVMLNNKETVRKLS